ncbi:MAG: hypothetical protein U1F52_02640 [Burkholderiales bacterium]
MAAAWVTFGAVLSPCAAAPVTLFPVSFGAQSFPADAARFNRVFLPFRQTGGAFSYGETLVSGPGVVTPYNFQFESQYAAYGGATPTLQLTTSASGVAGGFVPGVVGHNAASVTEFYELAVDSLQPLPAGATKVPLEMPVRLSLLATQLPPGPPDFNTASQITAHITYTDRNHPSPQYLMNIVGACMNVSLPVCDGSSVNLDTVVPFDVDANVAVRLGIGLNSNVRAVAPGPFNGYANGIIDPLPRLSSSADPQAYGLPEGSDFSDYYALRFSPNLYTVAQVPVPEPSTWLTGFVGVATLAVRFRRRASRPPPAAAGAATECTRTGRIASRLRAPVEISLPASRRLARALPVAALLAACAPASAQVQFAAETGVAIIAPCPGFCGGPNGRFAFDDDGGESFVVSDSSASNTDGSGRAQATLDGPTGLGVLRAEARSLGNSRASALASAMQGFYVGPDGGDRYALEVTLTGQATGSGHVIVAVFRDTDPASPFSYASDGSTLLREVYPGTPDLDGLQTIDLELPPDGSTQAVSGALALTGLRQGDLFYVWAALEVVGRDGTYADALHTVNMAFTNPTGLSQAAPVPEPEAWAMLGVGIGMLMLLGGLPFPANPAGCKRGSRPLPAGAVGGSTPSSRARTP